MNNAAHSVLFQLSPISLDLEDYVQIIEFVDFDVVSGCSVNSHRHLLIPRSLSWASLVCTVCFLCSCYVSHKKLLFIRIWPNTDCGHSGWVVWVLWCASKTWSSGSLVLPSACRCCDGTQPGDVQCAPGMAVRLLGEVRRWSTELRVGKVAFQLNQQSRLDYRKVNSLKPQMDHTFVVEAKLEVKCKFKKWGVFSVHVVSLIWVLCEVLQPKMERTAEFASPLKEMSVELQSNLTAQVNYTKSLTADTEGFPSRLYVDCTRTFSTWQLGHSHLFACWRP